jgi:hypothetical protein
MKRLLLVLLLVTVFQGFSQTKGISYQAVILNPNPQELPGDDAQGNILPNSAVTIQFTIVNATGTEEYQENHSTLTDRYGMINLLIGTGSSTGSNDFADIVWNGNTKKLKVGINFSGNGNNFVALNEQLLTYMPQPVSTATQSALDFKAPLASPTFTGTPTLPTGTIGVTQTAGTNTTAIATTAFVLANATTTLDATTTVKGIVKLAGDLGGTADLPTVPTLALKAPLASPTFTGTVSGIDKTMVGLGSVDNTTDLLKPVSTATQSALDLKVPLASPTFTGTPTLPAGTIGVTQTAGNNTTAIATTAFVLANAGGSVSGFTHYLGEAFNGGIIYYLYKGSDGLEPGLIVALTESTAAWQTSGTLVNANRTEDGAYNTALMTNSSAKTYVATLGAGWYLPSIDELGLLYYNRYSVQKALRAGVGTLLSTTGTYWSSNEFSVTHAYHFNFNYGYANGNIKTSTNPVRGVRAF